MSEVEMLNSIITDLNFLKEKIVQIELTVNEIDSDVHRRVNPEYLNELDQIEKRDKRVRIKNIDDFDQRFGL
ncbi:MAG: hypothetical protein KAI86_09305 [Desulfobacterales bacterium]|nr:hypothetical protein [Desulfobacterales bacterium]